MRQAFIILSAVIALLASAKTNTTRPVAGISEKALLMKTINAENDTASFADKIILSGYKKTRLSRSLSTTRRLSSFHT